ncbi:MAG TPA: SDR family oxidoreductase [Nitriliruptorales bacterium]|nr:SDR family oxidoreductase [Nitriliruptorales bacterium]
MVVDRTVIVTGGASGLGAAVADVLADAGATPVVLDLRAPRGAHEHHVVDLAEPRVAEETVRKVAERHGGLGAVVTCAAMDVPSPFADLDGDTWDRIVTVNLLGTAAVVRAALPYLDNGHGRVVTVASTLGLRALPAATAYCASKFGIVGFTRALALELAGRVGVTMLVPGGMRTGFFDDRPDEFKPAPDQMLNDPADVAQAVLFALQQPPRCEIRELVVTPSVEPSWP